MLDQKQIESKIFRHTFNVNERVKLHVTFNHSMMEKAANWMEIMKIERQIPDVDEVDSKYPGVVELAKIIMTKDELLSREQAKLPEYMRNSKKKTPDQILKESIRKWTAHVTSNLNAIQTEAVIIALVDEGELEVDGISDRFFKWEYVAGTRVYSVHPAIEVAPIDAKWFKREDANKARLEEGLPAHFEKNPLDVREQMLVLVDAVKRANPDFGIELNQFLGEYANIVTKNAIGLVQEVVAQEYDENGFPPESVDTDTHETDGNPSEKVGRKPRTTGKKVQAV